MANNQLLTTDMIADRALMRFSENLSFINTIPRTYASEFKEGAPAIGDTLRVAVPQHAQIVSGRVAQPAPLDTIIRNVKVIDQLNFSVQYTSSELALDIEEFDRRYLSQQVADLAVTVEAAVQNLAMLSIPNQTGPGSAAQWTQLAYANIARKYIMDNGAGPSTMKMLMNTAAETTLVPALAGLFNSQKQLDVQYEDGTMGRASGFDWNCSTVSPIFTNGAGTGYLVMGGNQQGSAINVDTGTGLIAAGSIVTFAGVVAVHPQTKVSLGYLRQFVTTSALTGAGVLNIYPALTLTGSEQNVTASPADNAPITIDQPASSSSGISMAYRPEAFAFATVDLPELAGWKTSRRQYNGVSMRVTEGSSIVNDMNLTRFDIMYAFGALRPEWAARITNDNADLTPA